MPHARVRLPRKHDGWYRRIHRREHRIHSASGARSKRHLKVLERWIGRVANSGECLVVEVPQLGRDTVVAERQCVIGNGNGRVAIAGVGVGGRVVLERMRWRSVRHLRDRLVGARLATDAVRNGALRQRLAAPVLAWCAEDAVHRMTSDHLAKG